MEPKKSYTLKEIQVMTKELNDEKAMVTIRGWFADKPTVNGNSRPNKYSYDTVMSVLKEKLNKKVKYENKSDLLEKIKKEDNDYWIKLKQMENDPQNPYFDAREQFYSFFGEDPQDYAAANNYAKKHKQEFLNSLLIQFFIRELGYSFNIDKIEEDLFNKYCYEHTSPKTETRNGKTEFAVPQIPIWRQSKNNIDNINIDAYFKKIK